MPMTPELGYARAADGTHIAFLVSGRGPRDILWLRGIYSNVEHEWQEPTLARILRRLGTVGRVISMDRRGTGLSDRIIHRPSPTIEDRSDDIRAVLDAAGSRRPVVVGITAGSAICSVFAASHPDRVAGLVLYGPDAERGWGSGLPADQNPAFAGFVEAARAGWGSVPYARRIIANNAPSRRDDASAADWLADEQRLSGSVDDGIAVVRMEHDTDVTDVLPTIHVPTCVIARGSVADRGAARAVAAAIPGASLVELEGEDLFLLGDNSDELVDAIEQFVGGLGPADDVTDDHRILATVLVTDIVGSTATAVELGDRAWAELLGRHHAIIRSLLERFRGREIDTAGDGFLATFDGPGRAIRCASAAIAAVAALGLEIRAGIHTGEVELVDGALRGVAVHVAARVAALAAPSEVLVTGTVRDLVAGSGIAFEDRGRHALKGLAAEWPLLAPSEAPA